MDLSKYCLISKELANNTKKVRFMYKEKPDDEKDSGWRFFTGDENQSYVDNPANILSANLKDVVEEIDFSVQKYLDCEVGKAFERESETEDFIEAKAFKFGEDLL